MELEAQVGEGGAQPQGCRLEGGRTLGAAGGWFALGLAVRRVGMDHGGELGQVALAHDRYGPAAELGVCGDGLHDSPPI
jgi:hypothetical protein